jgi:hypothetical protein
MADEDVVIIPKKEVKSVPDRLSDLGDLYAQRNKLYGDNYKNTGKVLKGMFPNGITLNTEAQFNRFALFIQIIHKSTRIAQSLPRDSHEDSLDDLAVYAQMLRHWEDEIGK